MLLSWLVNRQKALYCEHGIAVESRQSSKTNAQWTYREVPLSSAPRDSWRGGWSWRGVSCGASGVNSSSIQWLIDNARRTSCASLPCM